MGTTTLRRRFTVEEYYRMAETGILKPDDRVELIEGEIIQMSPIGRMHAAWVDFLTSLFVTALKGKATVRVQNPVRIGNHSEPEPDLMVLKHKADFYASGHPGPEDVLLLIEVADSSAESDRTGKLRLYALAGIAEVWVVNLEKHQIEVYRKPRGNEYQSTQTHARGSSASPAAFPEIAVSIDQLPA
jgi:hypothetical protein